MDIDGRRRAAAARSAPRTSVDGGEAPVVAPVGLPGGPQSILATEHWGSSAFGPSAAAAQPLQLPTVATTASHVLTTPLFRPNWTMYCPPESALASSAASSRVMADRLTDEHIVRRVSMYDSSLHYDQQLQQQQQHQRCCVQQQQQKRRRSCYSTESPPRDESSSTVTRSTSFNESSTNVFDSSSSSIPSSFLRHHRPSYRPLSVPYRIAPSLLPWSVELLSARSAMDPVIGCLGAVRLPAHARPLQRDNTHLPPSPVDVLHEVEGHEHRHQRRLSVSTSDKQSSFTSVTHQCTSSSGGRGGGYQLSEGNSAVILNI